MLALVQVYNGEECVVLQCTAVCDECWSGVLEKSNDFFTQSNSEESASTNTNSPFGHDEMRKAWRCSTQVLLVVLTTITFAGFTSLWIAVHNVAPPPSRGRTPVQTQLSEQQRQAVEQPQAAPPQQPPHQHQAEDVCLSDTVYKCHTEHGNGTQYMAWDVHRGTCVDFKPRTRAGEVL